jgi:hypothetical protein
MRRASGHHVLCVHVLDRGLQLNVHRSRSGGETDLPTDRPAILRKTGITRQRKRLARLPPAGDSLLKAKATSPGKIEYGGTCVF